MPNSFAEFLRSGRIAGVQFGLTRNDVVEVLGNPPDWLGKWPPPEERPPDFWRLPPEVQNPQDAELWFYHNGALGVGFDVECLVHRLFIYPADADFPPAAFLDWPKFKAWTIGELIGWLRAQEIPFVMPRPEEGAFQGWFVVGDRCLVLCPFPEWIKVGSEAYHKGHFNWQIQMFQVFPTADDLHKHDILRSWPELPE